MDRHVYFIRFLHFLRHIDIGPTVYTESVLLSTFY
jgi:hypothetical protein